MKKKIRAKSTLYAISCLGLVFAAGCAAPQEFEAGERICLENFEKAQAMELAEDVLGEMYFSIEKADVERGIIRTRPLAAAQFFEIWRGDNVGGYNATEANLHSVQRIVELNVTGRNNQLCVDCSVKVRRLSLPEREVNSAAKAHSLFSESTSSLQKLELSSQQKKQMAWIELGSDARLQTEILNRIEKQLARLRIEGKKD